MLTYRALFASPEFRALWTAGALTTAASTTSSLALATLVHRTTGSALLTAVAMFGPSAAQALGATTLMSAADASPPRRTLLLVAAASTAALALQALPGLPTPVRLLLVVGVAYVTSVGSGARWGLLTDVVPAAAYPLARSTMNVAVGAFQVVGFAVGGLLLTALTTAQVFVLAALVSAAALPVLRLGVAERAPRRSGRAGLAETVRSNRLLLAHRDTRTLLVALCVPNGLVVGCEALFVPYAGERAGWLLVAGAAGMMAGDLVVGRFLTPAARRRSNTALRLLLAVPFLAFAVAPGIPLAAVLVGVATVGYAAALAQQEWLVALTPGELRGQVLGVESALRMTGQGVFAAAAGALADLSAPGAVMAGLAAASVLVSLVLAPGLRRAARAATAVPA
ncbi:MFS transporter [Geodermatophilus nigrescens]|uniref:Predicted arabinose efflux permease, MFS family n=1 Tax=Geodermatophilus nigrescens TaxID=1070870 RepID=A0A1M5EFC0_9ACTN|nr:MFS transporter [Geodermatophilus nigrescens]SHF77993.1 Predicted arabinose efflux permease, MFS family [Geodermatophilus nigrescens]